MRTVVLRAAEKFDLRVVVIVGRASCFVAYGGLPIHVRRAWTYGSWGSTPIVMGASP